MDSWADLLGVMLTEPKPSVRAVCVDGHERRTIRVVHDGREGWRLDDGVRTYISDGRVKVLVENGKINRFRDMHVHCMPLPQSLIHPRLWTNLRGTASLGAQITVQDRSATRVRLPDWQRGAGAELLVDNETGMILSLRRLDAPDVPATLEQLVVGEEIAPDTFSWLGEIDEEVTG